jgi:hypothetical protein
MDSIEKKKKKMPPKKEVHKGHVLDGGATEKGKRTVF